MKGYCFAALNVILDVAAATITVAERGRLSSAETNLARRRVETLGISTWQPPRRDRDPSPRRAEVLKKLAPAFSNAARIQERRRVAAASERGRIAAAPRPRRG